MRGNRLVRLLLLLANALVIFGLGISLAAPLIPPHVLIFPAFFGLAFIPLFLLNILYGLFWVFIRPKYTWFSAIALALSVPNFLNHISISGSTDMSGIRVMSYNVRLFDLYNWTGSHKTQPLFVDFFKNNKADIYCFQEYFNSEKLPTINTQDSVADVLNTKNRHEYFTAELHDKKHRFGIATYSKYPIIKRGLVPLDTAQHNVAIYTDIVILKDTVRVFNMHLASVHLSAMEKEINQNIAEQNQLKQWQSLKLLLRKLAGGYKKRSRQAEHIANYISESPHPVIVCGDFNDTPGSYAYSTIRGEMQDAFVNNGAGFGTSYAGYYPSLRIDYILHSDDFSTSSFQTIDEDLSDHRPLISSLRRR